MSAEVYLTKLSADDKDLDRVTSAYLEFAPNDCNDVAVAVDGLKSYITGMNSYFKSDVFAINTPGKDSSVGFMSVCLNGCKVTIEDLFISQEMRKLGVGRAAIEALGGAYPHVAFIELLSVPSAEEFYAKIGFELVIPATDAQMSLWRKNLY